MSRKMCGATSQRVKASPSLRRMNALVVNARHDRNMFARPDRFGRWVQSNADRTKYLLLVQIDRCRLADQASELAKLLAHLFHVLLQMILINPAHLLRVLG